MAIAAAMAALAPLASAYYYWIYFNGRSAPFTPVPARFDLSSLPNQNIPLLISSSGPAVMMPGDTFPGLVSQLRSAASVWNGVSTSAAKFNFAGLSPMTQADSTAEVDIVFDDNMPPGLLAQTRLTTIQNVGTALASGATFIPVLNARVQFHNDLTLNQQASNSDGFFITMVHELGHSLGLQHTLTSSVMSTQFTAAVTKAAPLAADDVVGLSLLYPANGFPGNTGSISGTVSLGGSGVNLASVVAISTNGTAISALSNPDGTYRIDGIPQGSYYVYAHPLPPPAQGEAYPDNIIPPQDGAGNIFAANTGFGTQFYGGTTDWTLATQIAVAPAQVTAGINFNVPSRPAGPAVSEVTTYGYLGSQGQYVVGQPPVPSGSSIFLAFNGVGTVVNSRVAPGLNVSVMGGPARVRAGSITYFDGYVLVTIDASQVSTYTPCALAITLNGDVYVLPNAFSVVPSAPPMISGVKGATDQNGNATVNVAGSNLSASTRILFDGAPASVTAVNGDGSLTVAAPPAAFGYSATVEALGSDSQTSAQFLSGAAPTFVYGGPGSPFINANPASALAGADSTVDLVGINTNFADGQVVVGFGSSDITVKRVWVVSPGLLRMNISVSASATPGTTTVTVANGLQLATLSATFQIGAANPAQISLRAPVLNQATGLPGVPVGGVALINTTGLPINATTATLAGWTLTIAGQPAAFAMGDHGQLIVQVPGGLLTGPSVVQFTPANGVPVTGVIPPILMQVDPPAPVIATSTGAAGLAGAASIAAISAHAGDTITLTVTGLADTLGNFPAASSVIVNAGGINAAVNTLTPIDPSANICQISVTLPSTLSSGPQPLYVRLGTRESAAISIIIL